MGQSARAVWLRTAFWFLLTLVAFDVGTNLAFPYPTNPLSIHVPTVNRYFDYGRSLEGKMLRLLGPTDETSAPVARAGWLADVPSKEKPSRPEPGHLLISVYGMSFAGDVATELQRLDPKIDLRLILGPGAPPNHSFEAYLRDRKGHGSDIVILGILASSVAGMDSMCGATLLTDAPMPFTFPIFTLERGKLAKIEPLVESLSDFRETMWNPERRRAYRDHLYQNDKLISPFILEANLLDRSTLVRLVRRAYTQSMLNRWKSTIHDQNGFLSGWDKVPVLKAMVIEFAESARADQRMPVVLLIHDRGFGDHLFGMLRSTLEERHIPFLSTHDIAPATINTNFVPDGHFTHEANHRITLKVLELIQSRYRPVGAR